MLGRYIEAPSNPVIKLHKTEKFMTMTHED